MTNPQPYGYAPVAPPPRPPLTKRQRRGALVAGAVSLFLLQLGFTVAMIPVALVIVVLLVVGFVNLLSTTTRDGFGWDRIWSNGSFDPAPWIVWLIVAVVVGIVIMVLAVLVSGWILRGHGVNRARATTWSAIGIGIVGQWIVGGIIGFIANLASAGLQQVNGGVGSIVGGAVIVVLSSLITTVVVGALAWWWMAFAFRASVAAPLTRLG